MTTLKTTLFLAIMIVLLSNEASCWRRRRRRYVPPAVNGGWSGWAHSGSCSKTCGGGLQRRTRSCTNPRPAHGGRQCAGSSTSQISCSIHHCPIRPSSAISTPAGIRYQLISCFRIGRRRLHQLLINEENPSSPAWNGHFIDWNNWNGYINAFLDRCATKAKAMNLKVFGATSYGTCWGDRSVSNALSTFAVGLRDFSICVKGDWGFCQEGALRCVGGSKGMAVYQLM